MIRKKEDTYIFSCKYGKIVFTIPQQSIEQSLEFYDIIESKNIIKLMKYIKEFLHKYGTIKYKGFFWNKKRLLNTFFYNYLEFIEKISIICHKPYKSKYDGINIIVGEDRPGNYGNNMLVMSKHTGIPVDELMNRLSLEEWGIYQDAIIHNNLEIDKKTRKYNDTAELNKKTNMTKEQRKKAMKKFREDLEKGTRKTIYVGRLKNGN